MNNVSAADEIQGRSATIDCFALGSNPPKLVPASPLRNWMEKVVGKHAYRCLPLTIANSYGWEILCPYDIAVDWSGGANKEDLVVRRLDGEGASSFAHSNFAHGIVTFHPGYIFRTMKRWNLLVTGPLNNPKRGISPLTGVVETDWLPYPFTMNWTMTDPGTIVFERDEPFCHIIPVGTSTISDCQPVIRDLSNDPTLAADYTCFLRSRTEFLEGLMAKEQSALDQQWQRYYFLGQMPDGRENPDHIRKLRANSPIDLR